MIVALPQGRLRGADHAGVIRFDGVPFGAPPTGERRFAPPEPAPGWRGTLDACTPPRGPLQLAGAMLGSRPVGETSEDCLHLNVVTPGLDGKRPVMVWIYGGGFVNGSAADAIHHGERLVRQGDVVLVTLDYRLGAFGFLHTDAGTNVGMQDQLLALQWVRDHIAEFGGDPEQVTLFGESAGGMCVLDLMGTPAADTLFQAAIVQSGAASWLAAPADAKRACQAFAAELDSDDVDHWRRLPPETLLQAQQTVDQAIRATTGRGAFRPLLDGNLVQCDGLTAQARPINRQRPLMIGSNGDEQRLFLNLRRMQRDAGVQRLARALTRYSDTPVDAANAILSGYAARHPELSENELLAAAETFLYYRVPILRLLNARQDAGATSWNYLFTRPSPALRGRLGACHALEIPFVFGTLDAPGMARFAGDDAQAWQLSEHMMRLWSQFAHHQDPRPAAPEWQPWDPATELAWQLDQVPAPWRNPDTQDLQIWQPLLSTLFGGRTQA